MRTIFFSLAFVLAFTIPASAQFSYKAWNAGIQTGSLKIANGMTRYDADANQQVFLADSVNSQFNITNLRFNIEGLNTKFYVKTGVSLPIAKHTEHDSETVIGKHMEIDIKFGYGFAIKEVVGFQFGLNLGIFNITQEKNLKVPGKERLDYFVPSVLSSPTTGQKYFGGMAAWQGGLLVSNVIAFSDNIALRTTYSHNNLKNKRKTVDGRNDQLEFGFYYSNVEWHNIGIHVNFVQNWIHLKGFEPDDNVYSYSAAREYPATKVRMTTIYIGINIPIVFGG